MAHDVFLSYSRTDRAVCDEILQRIRRIGYVPYRDVDDLSGGQPWRDQLQEALSQPGLKPYVVVLCTRAAVEKPEGVLDEIRLARENDLAVIPIELDPGAMKSLFGAAGYESPGRIQYIDAIDPSGGYVVDDRLEDALRRALTRKVRDWLGQCRVLARDWSERLNPDVSFWETTWRDYFPSGPRGWPDSVVLTARGGSGKSFLIARCVRQLLDDPEVYPVLVDEAMLRDPETLSRGLGARSALELPRQVEALGARLSEEHTGWKPMRVIFVVDGLDQMVVPGDRYQDQLVGGLNVLVNSAPVLIGCRKEAWDGWYRGRVSVCELAVPELDEPQVRRLLRSTRLAGQFNPLLQVPFFLDTALENASIWPSLPRTETDFLRQIWDDAVREDSSGDSGRTWILETLADCQLEQLAYDVPFKALSDRLGYLPEYLKGLSKLKAKGLLVEQPRMTGTTLRMRHDLLDNYSMVRLILGRDTVKQVRDLCSRCGKDCGWSLLASLVQAAHDRGDDDLKLELFTEFLFVLDHKPFGDDAMTRAWAITHVLTTCFHPLFELIVQSLDGEPTTSLNGKNPAQAGLRPSSLKPPRLTQDTVSTLASAFMVLHTGSLEEAAKAVPALTAALARWEPIEGSRKGRFLDALGKYRTDEALDAIVSFGRSQLRDRTDLDSLLYVAQNLRHFPHQEAYDLLGEIISDPDVDSMVRRVAAEGLNHLLPGRVQVPPRGEDEIVRKLKPRESNGRYTDWHVVQDYADYIRRTFHQESFGPRVLEALIEALKHDQTYVRGSVARTLALFNEPAARDALLSEILEPAVPAEVRSACLEALEWQLKNLAEPKARQSFRYLLLRAAGAARHAGAGATERGLVDLAMNVALRHPEDWPLTQDALEVVPPGNAPWTVRCSFTEEEIDPAIVRALAEAESEDVGPNKEPKYRLVGLDVGGGSSIDIALAPTTWQLGKSFHNAVRNHPDRFLRDGRRWLEPVPLGDARLPGLAVVHVVVLTADGFVLAAQRAKTLSYAPLHWSISFEEQVTEQDVREGDRTFHHAAYRGMVEEFGIAAEPSRIHLVSALLEMDNLNLAAVVLIEATQTLEEIRQSWSSEPPPSHAWEAHALDGIEADPAMLDRTAGGADLRLEPLHPTSRLRCAVLARWLARRAAG